MTRLAVLMMLLLSGCAKYADWHGAPADYAFPAPPASLASRCDDAPVVRSAVETAALARYALAKCRRKHDGLLDWIDAVRRESAK